LREAEFLKRRIKKIACIIAGEWPAGAIGAAQPGRQTDDQEPRVDRPE
jgi:hypothetical protein